MKKLFKKIKHRFNTKKGFTLLETLVAIFILTLALTGPIYIATLAIRGSVDSRDNISAYYLAEEAIEAARNKRDTAVLTSTPFALVAWDNAFTACYTNACSLSRETNGSYSFSQCSGVCLPLSFDPQNPTVIYAGTAPTGSVIDSKFTRSISFQEINPNQEIKMTVTISWKNKGRDKEFQIVEHLHNLEYGKYYKN